MGSIGCVLSVGDDAFPINTVLKEQEQFVETHFFNK